MDKETDKAFEKLWKIKLLRDLIKLEKEIENAKVTRTYKSDNLRAIKFVEYGFEEGIKFVRENNYYSKEKINWKDQIICEECKNNNGFQWIPNGGSGYYRCKKCKTKMGTYIKPSEKKVEKC